MINLLTHNYLALVFPFSSAWIPTRSWSSKSPKSSNWFKIPLQPQPETSPGRPLVKPQEFCSHRHRLLHRWLHQPRPWAKIHLEVSPFKAHKINNSPYKLYRVYNQTMGRSHQRHAVMEHLFWRFRRIMLKKSNLVSILTFASFFPKTCHCMMKRSSARIRMQRDVVIRKFCVQGVKENGYWTVDWCLYKFPLRSQELLQYFSLIRHAARLHKGLGWVIYDYNFRQRASKNKSLVWSTIDSQL